MDQNSLVIAIAVAIALFVFMRRRRSASGRTSAPAERRAAEQQKPRSMPRVGTPGTVTPNQIIALRRHHFTPDKSWSEEEAWLILDAVQYLRAVCRTIAGEDDGPPPLEVQNELLRMVLTTEDVREYVRRWGEERRAAGIDEFSEDQGELPRNNQFEHIAKAARKFLAPPPAVAAGNGKAGNRKS